MNMIYGAGVGGSREALNHCVLRLAPAHWASGRLGGSPGASVTGERSSPPWEPRSPSTRKQTHVLVVRREIQFIYCSQVCLLDSFLSFCHFYQNA